MSRGGPTGVETAPPVMSLPSAGVCGAWYSSLGNAGFDATAKLARKTRLDSGNGSQPRIGPRDRQAGLAYRMIDGERPIPVQSN